MFIIKNITIYVMSLLYIIVGIKHFMDVEYFVSIVPTYISWKQEAVFISGFFEILLGILLLFHKTRKLAAWGIILLLITVFPANIYLYVSEVPRDILNISKTDALIRIPFQIPLIIISYWHSKKISSKILSNTCIILFVPTIIYFISL
jgi:uncharacterized membrane protein|tara:strand:- start:113660 stop:114103 length:444 start_codon:yes stop_codon:yes gene_type:complete